MSQIDKHTLDSIVLNQIDDVFAINALDDEYAKLPNPLLKQDIINLFESFPVQLRYPDIDANQYGLVRLIWPDSSTLFILRSSIPGKWSIVSSDSILVFTIPENINSMIFELKSLVG